MLPVYSKMWPDLLNLSIDAKDGRPGASTTMSFDFGAKYTPPHI